MSYAELYKNNKILSDKGGICMPADRELIKVGSFDEKFKNLLRDYYSYGLGQQNDTKEVPKTTKATQDIDRNRLSNIFRDDMKWENTEEKVSLITSKYSQEMKENPFHKVYHFCKYKSEDLTFFFHTMAGLSDQLCVNQKAFEILKSNKEREGQTEKFGEAFDDAYAHLQKGDCKKSAYKTSDLICFYPKVLAVNGKTANDNNNNKKYNLKLEELNSLGVIRQVQKIGKKGGKGDRRWNIDGLLTMKNLLDEGAKIDKNFKFHLQCLLDFYSKYYIFGEIGVFLMDRIRINMESPFRLKHEHYMQALNDYNCIDLLYAIEEGKWCRIRYKNGINKEETELLCYPIELRVGFRNGRESLVYYEPFKECYTTMRVEFIESVSCCADEQVRQALQTYSEHYTDELLDMEIQNAKNSMQYSWGMSTTVGQMKNAKLPVTQCTVKLRISFDPKTESFIIARLKRECRFGTVIVNNESGYVDFEVSVSDAGELIPWVRSFYSRIIFCEGIPEDRFVLKNDVEMMAKAIQPIMVPSVNDKMIHMKMSQSWQKEKWKIPDEIQDILPTGEKSWNHNRIFHEMFSAHYYIMSEALMQKFFESMEDGNGKQKTNSQIVNEAIRRCEKQMGENTGYNINGEIKKTLDDPKYGFVIQNIQGKDREKQIFYECTKKVPKASSVSFYRDIIPLSQVEKRWLLSVLDDSKAGYFLSKEEINFVQNCIQNSNLQKNMDFNITALPMQYITCFDRYHIKDDRQEQRYVMQLAAAIITSETLLIQYMTVGGKKKVGSYNPIILEFSKDHNRFQGYFEHSETKRIAIFNLANIQSIKETKEKFNSEETRRNLRKYLDGQCQYTEIEFSNERNTADRILTEFAPWKKKCMYDKTKGIYRLRIDYQKSDWLDLVIRLMGYGPAIRFTKADDPVYLEVWKRVENQRKQLCGCETLRK